MLDWIKSWFGKGRVMVKWTGIDDNGIRKGTAKCPYVGRYDPHELMRHFKKEILYQHSIVITDIQIVSHIPD